MIHWLRISILFFLVLLALASCKPGKEDVIGFDNMTIDITGTETRGIVEETIAQRNCGGNAEVANEVQKSRLIEHVIEAQNGLAVNTNGRIEVAGSSIDLGATVARQLGRTYGTAETLSRSVTVKALPGTNMTHRIKQQEVWAVGVATVVINNNPIEIPFSFLDDFSLELIESTDMLDCPATKGATTNATNVADSASTQLIPPVEVTVQEVTRLVEVTRVQQPTATPTLLRATRTAVPPSATAYFSPKVTFSRPTEQNWDDIATLWQKVSYQDLKSPGVETYDLTIHSSDVYRWSFAWCALNSTRLNDILQPLTVSFLVDGRALPDNDLLQHDLTASDGWKCRYWSTVLSAGQSGETVELEVYYELSRSINDGKATYTAGNYHQVIRAGIR